MGNIPGIKKKKRKKKGVEGILHHIHSRCQPIKLAHFPAAGPQLSSFIHQRLHFEFSDHGNSKKKKFQPGLHFKRMGGGWAFKRSPLSRAHRSLNEGSRAKLQEIKAPKQSNSTTQIPKTLARREKTGEYNHPPVNRARWHKL